MLYSKIRFLVGIIALIIGGIVHFRTGFGSAWYIYLAGVIMLLTHFLFGTVAQAFNRLNKGQVDDAEHLILQIKRPEWLYKTHRALYYFVLGIVALQKKQTGFGEQHLQQALDIGLHTKTNNALAALHIAHINFVNNNYKKADDYRKIAESFESNDLIIKENLQKLKEVLAKGSN